MKKLYSVLWLICTLGLFLCLKLNGSPVFNVRAALQKKKTKQTVKNKSVKYFIRETVSYFNLNVTKQMQFINSSSISQNVLKFHNYNV